MKRSLISSKKKAAKTLPWVSRSDAPNSRKRKIENPPFSIAVLILPPILEGVPEHIGVDATIDLAIHIDDVHVTLGQVPDNRAVESASVGILRNIDAQRAVDL